MCLRATLNFPNIWGQSPHMLHWAYTCSLAVSLMYLGNVLQIFWDWQDKGQGPCNFFAG